MMKMRFFHFQSSKKDNTELKTSLSVNQLSLVRMVSFAQFNIPLNDAETQKMQLSARELQEIIDEAWKNPEFQAASKN